MQGDETEDQEMAEDTQLTRDWGRESNCRADDEVRSTHIHTMDA